MLRRSWRHLLSGVLTRTPPPRVESRSTDCDASRPNGAAAVTRTSASTSFTVRAREHLWAALILGVVVAVYLWPALFEGKTFSPAALLYNGAPWKALRPAGVASYLNPALSDVPTQFYPWLVYARDSLHHGVLPLWNPYVGGGTPFFANAQVALFSPFNLPVWLLPMTLGLAVSAAARLWVAGFGMYLLLRTLRLGMWPALLGGVSFAFCSFDVVWLSHPHVNVAVMLPVVLWLAERVLQRGRAADAIALTGAVAVAFLGGHPGTEVHLGFALVIYCAVRLIFVTRSERARRVVLLAAAACLGTVIDAVALLPAAMLVTHGSSVTGRLGGGITNPLSAARTLLFPDWWGRPGGAMSAGPTDFNERTVYAGVLAAVLAASALLSRGAWRRQASFAVLGLVGLCATFGVPGVHWLVVHLPGLNSVQDARLLLLTDFAIAGLAAFGLQRLCERRGRLRVMWLIGATLAVGLVSALSLHPSLHELRTTVNHLRTGTQYDSAHILSLTAVAWTFILLGVAVIGVVVCYRRRSWRLLAPLLLLVAVADAYHFAGRFQPIGPAHRTIPPRPPAVAFLQRRAGQGRTVGLQNALWNDYQMVYHLPDVRSYDPPYPDQRYLRLWRLAYPAQPDSVGLYLDSITPPGLQVLDVLGARFIVQDPASPPIAAPGLRQVYSGPDATVYENSGAAPRSFVAQRTWFESGESNVIARLLAHSFEPSREAVVQSGPALHGMPNPATGGGSTTIVRDDGDRVDIAVRTSSAALAVLDDTLTPGWTVEVDGRAAAALRVNYVMRGVFVPGGLHTVRWRYRVPGLRTGLIITLFGLAATLTWAAIAVRRIRRRRTRS